MRQEWCENQPTPRGTITATKKIMLVEKAKEGKAERMLRKLEGHEAAMARTKLEEKKQQEPWQNPSRASAHKRRGRRRRQKKQKKKHEEE